MVCQWVYLQASKPHLPSHWHHNSGHVAEIVAMATCSTVANVVGMIDTEAGLSVQLVRYVHLPLSTNWERTEQWYGDFDIAQQGGVTVFNIQRLVYQPFDIAWDAVCSHLLSFSVTPQCRRPSAYKRPAL
jgi:hypothetical protein